MQSLVEPGSQAEQVGRLLLAVAIVLFLPALPFGNYLIYPFVILTTWFHEMGHGLTALALGQDFVRLMIFANGSGVAESMVSLDASVFTRAAIAAGGPLAPSFVGAGLIMTSAHPKLWRPMLWAVAAAILISVIIYVRSVVGYAVLPSVGAILAVIAWRARAGFVRFTLQFIGILAAMSMISDFDYLFTEEAVIGGDRILSDTGQIEAALVLPHWVWATLLLLTSVTMVGASLKYALNERRLRARPPKPPANVLQFKRKR
ncbi:M50 family metallopeptidase [Erythrobacter rubeus]|uniref:M50 family metallopeptidase n=1 Tax=Erythrobacter rubeus TaxID=2760803 RepID=A0ABR8KTP7_9SPHN|nr:M50 family metallopeptidase [Erythrobacter rubeus]MBD2842970.1 M50 family metallopeptidase [Erythrobacter rubeus]